MSPSTSPAFGWQLVRVALSLPQAAPGAAISQGPPGAEPGLLIIVPRRLPGCGWSSSVHLLLQVGLTFQAP
jgi:hypothetical protein